MKRVLVATPCFVQCMSHFPFYHWRLWQNCSSSSRTVLLNTVYVTRSLTMFYSQKPLPSWWLQLWSWMLAAASRRTFLYFLLLTQRHCQPQVKKINAREYETNILNAWERSWDMKYLWLSTQLKELEKNPEQIQAWMRWTWREWEAMVKLWVGNILVCGEDMLVNIWNITYLNSAGEKFKDNREHYCSVLGDPSKRL